MTIDYAQRLIDSLEKHGEYQPRTIRFYKEQSALVLRALYEVDPSKNPVNLDRDTLRQLVLVLRAKHTVSTQKDYLIALKRMCENEHNYVFSEYRVMFPTDTRPNVDWLSHEQAQELLDVWKMPLDDMIVTLELLHGLRRIEVIRIRTTDIHLDEGYIEVRGKGRAGGKLRSIPMHPDFRRAYERWMEERNQMRLEAEDDSAANLLVYLRNGKLHQYEEIKGRAIDDHIKQLSERTGIEFSNHTLRRTFGRELYRSGVDITVIATIFGHSSTTQTLKYLGLELDDMAKAMEIMRLRKN